MCHVFFVGHCSWSWLVSDGSSATAFVLMIVPGMLIYRCCWPTAGSKRDDSLALCLLSVQHFACWPGKRSGHGHVLLLELKHLSQSFPAAEIRPWPYTHLTCVFLCMLLASFIAGFRLLRRCNVAADPHLEWLISSSGQQQR